MYKKIKITLAYDGTAYSGWQRQSTLPSVQQTLEDALEKILKVNVSVVGASRTDAGAHARAQVAHAMIQSPIPLGGLRKALNAVLPDDIGVTDIEEVESNFHARYRASARTYEYHVVNQSAPDPLLARRAYHVEAPLSLGKMRGAARVWVGRHDFSSFCTQRAKKLDAVRTVKEARVVRRGSVIVYTVTANGFVRGMIRTMAQVLVEAGQGRWSPAAVKALMAKRDRRAAPKAAPAHGLYLVKVHYERDEVWHGS